MTRQEASSRRCPECGTPNGWHSQPCSEGLLTPAEIEEVRAGLRAAVAASSAAAAGSGLSVDPRIARAKEARRGAKPPSG